MPKRPKSPKPKRPAKGSDKKQPDNLAEHDFDEIVGALVKVPKKKRPKSSKKNSRSKK